MPDLDLIPRMLIRRFDIFAEWNRIKALKKHRMKEASARAYGLAVAKVVASRSQHGAAPEHTSEVKQHVEQDTVTEPWWDHLGSSEEFEHTIIARMGQTFYTEVFQPALQDAWDKGQKYEDIRDTLRKSWNVQRQTASVR